MKRCSVLISMFLLAVCSLALGQENFESRIGKVTVGPVNDGPTQVPFIVWGGDVAEFVANGGLSTTKDSLNGKAGLNLKLVPGDDFEQQVKDYLLGKSPYLRATVHMAALASDVLNRDPRTKPIAIVQLSWSAGDHIVFRDHIKNLNDLKTKKRRICLQAYGPHLGLLNDSLVAINATWNDVEPVWAKNLTGPDSPAEMMRKDPTIDGACVITPDMIGLCSGIDQVGNGAEGTIKGAHVGNSTATMSRSIADLWYCRSDFFNSNKAKVESFVTNYLQASEQLLAAKKLYADGAGKSPEYIKALKMAQSIYSEAVLPTLENDAHGLVSDASFARIPGNESFFLDPNNLTGFAAKQKSALQMAADLKIIKGQFASDKATWDYRKISSAVGVDYVAPVMATGRVKAEVTDFGADLDSNIIFSFEIKFDPERTDFPIDLYAADFERLSLQSQTFGNALIICRGRSDLTLALQNFIWAAKAKGLITGTEGTYKFKGTPLNMTDTASIINAIQNENLSGQIRLARDGKTKVPIDDPRTTVAAALQLSQARSAAVIKGLDEYVKSKNYKLDFSQLQPQGIGIANPIVPRPRNMEEAKRNMIVEIIVIKVPTEQLNEDSFDFDK